MPLVLGLRPCGGPSASFCEHGLKVAAEQRCRATPTRPGATNSWRCHPARRFPVSGSSPQAFTPATRDQAKVSYRIPHHIESEHRVGIRPLGQWHRAFHHPYFDREGTGILVVELHQIDRRCHEGSPCRACPSMGIMERFLLLYNRNYWWYKQRTSRV